MLKFSKVGLLNMMADLKGSDKLTLVGDHGVYIMSFAHSVADGATRPLVYAEGCDPEVDEDFYENKNDLFGGDDGGDDIGTVAELREFLSKCQNWMHIKLSASTMRIVSDIKHPVAKPKIDINNLPLELRKYVK